MDIKERALVLFYHEKKTLLDRYAIFRVLTLSDLNVKAKFDRNNSLNDALSESCLLPYCNEQTLSVFF